MTHAFAQVLGSTLLVLGLASPGPVVAEAGSGAEQSALPEVSMIEETGDAARYWPRWRGPSGQGQVDGGGYPDTWSDQQHVLWKVAVPGRGNSSPVVWGDRIFLNTAVGDGSKRGIVAFDRTSGEMLWLVEAPAVPAEEAHPKNGLASSTPATDGERVYAYLGNHGLLAVDFQGRQVWHQDLGRFNAFHGTASSPLLYRDRVIVMQDHRDGSFIAAFDKLTGRPLWRTPRRAQVGWNTPIAVRVGDQEQIVASGQQMVIAYDPETGAELWSAPGNTFEAIPTPVVGHDLIFSSSGRAGPTLAIRPPAPAPPGGDAAVREAEIVWKAAKGSPFVPSPVLHGEYLFMVNDMASVATCYRARTGEVLWQGRLGTAQREGFSSSPVVVDGKVFFTNDSGETFVLRAGPEFELLHVNQLGERVLASPALVEGRWYFRTETHLVAIGHPPAAADAAGRS